ncbi:MAG: serine/threonine-protein kinase [bacterium]
MNSLHLAPDSGPLARPSSLSSGASVPLRPEQKILEEIRAQLGAEGRALSPSLLAALEGLKKEGDPELLYQELLGTARRLSADHQDLSAQLILARLARPDLPERVQATARRELSAWSGGSFGLRAEFLFSRFCRDATDWRVIAPMLGASLIGRWVGGAALSRFTGMGAEGGLPWLLGGRGARIAAGGAAYLAEVPAFAALSRGLAPIPGGSWGQDLARSAISLGALKVFGALGNEGARFLNPAAAAPSLPAKLLAPTSALLGLMGAQRIEERFGLRPAAASGDLFLDSFASLLALGVGARLGREALGEGFAAWQRGLEIRSRMAELGTRPRGPWWTTQGASLAWAGPNPGRGAQGSAAAAVRPWVLMSANSKGDGGKKGDSLAAVEVPSIIVDPAIHEDPYVGRTFDGRYKVEALIGIGGMGKVYLATHEILGKKVAIKVLRETMARDKEVTERFLNEARAASSIDNPHIVDISDFGKLPNGSAYFVMEHLAGVSLASLIEGEAAVPLPRLLNVAVQIAEGLEAAHQKGIVHRDLKPDNVLLVNRGSEQDFVKILDFGIAKILKSNLRLTQAGNTFGTVQYMSPEQAMGIPVDPRSDVYAFGILLYELASGKVPFDGPDHINILHQQVGKAPTPLREVAPQVPAELEALVAKCLAKRPEERYASMEEVRLELERIRAVVSPKPPSDPGPIRALPEPAPMADPLTEPPQAVTLPPRRRLWPRFVGIGGGGAAAALIAGYLLARRREVQPAPSDAPMPPPDAPAAPPPDARPTKISVEPIEAPPKKIVTLSVVPSDARVFQGERDLGTQGLKVEVEAGAVLELEVRRKGFKSRKIRIDGSQPSLSVQLEREAAPKKRNPPKDPPPVKKRPEEEVVSPWK